MRPTVSKRDYAAAVAAIKNKEFDVYKAILARNKGRVGLNELRELAPNRDLLKRPRGWAARSVFDALRGEGLRILDVGSPDHWVEKEGKQYAVFAKTFPGAKPRRHVQAVMNILVKHGVACLIWDPETGFNVYQATDGKKYKTFEELPLPKSGDE